MMWLSACLLLLIFEFGIEGHEQSTGATKNVWTKYPPQEYFPLFRQAVKDILDSDVKLKMLFDLVTQNVGSVEPVYFDLSPDPATGKHAYHILTADQTTEGEVDGLSAGEATILPHDELTEVYGTLLPEADSGTVEPDRATEVYYTESPEDYAQSTQDRAIEQVYYTLTSDSSAEDSAPLNTEGDEELAYLERRVGYLYEDGQEPEKVFPDGEVGTEPDCPVCDGKSPLQVGSIRGIPGEHFPDYEDIPITSFTCADKKHVPGFYADLETGCQVFHVCWPHRRESFLCPIGTTFNQAILACDYWYSNNCSLAPLFHDVNDVSPIFETTTAQQTVSPEMPTEDYVPFTEEPIPSVDYTTYVYVPSDIPEVQPSSETSHEYPITEDNVSHILKFLPVKSKVVAYPTSVDYPTPGVKTIVTSKSVGTEQEKAAIFTDAVKEILQVAGNIAKDTTRFVVDKVTENKIKTESNGVKSKHFIQSKIPLHKHVVPVKARPHMKMVKVKPQLQPVPLRKPHLPALNARFVVKPAPLKVVKSRKNFPAPAKQPAASVYVKQKAFQVHEKPPKPIAGHHAPEIIMQALEMAGGALTRDILPLTRQALVQNYVKLSKTKQH